jgi:FkbM family methyltransferase
MLRKIFSFYWLQRIGGHIKKNGFLSFFKNSFSFLNRCFNPKILGEMPFAFLFNSTRRKLKNFCDNKLENFDKNSIKSFFNYYLDESKISENSIVYSFGLDASIGFEENLAKKKGCKILCYDPTENSVNYFKNYKNEKIFYFPYGIWIRDEMVKFYKPMDDDKAACASINNLFGTNTFKEFQCYKLKTLMKMNNHNKIDILKMDIEGVAQEVIYDMLEDNIYPNQICAEFEYSGLEQKFTNENHLKEWLNNLSNLILKMKEKNYLCYHMPRFSNMPYTSIEILFLKKDK